MKKNTITVIMLTLNEEYHLPNVIDNVKDFADNIFILDSFSSDKTLKIAKSKGVKVLQRKFTNFGDQWNYALTNCPFNSDWTMKIDPDEELTDSLKEEIKIKINSNNSKSAYEFRRRLWFLGKPLNVYNKVLRIWKTGSCKFSEVLVNEHPIINGEIGYLHGVMEHYDSMNLDHWINKQNNYSTLEALTIFNNLNLAAKPKLFGSSLQRKMYFKKIIFKIPFKYFFITYFNLVFKGAWKNGKSGLRWAKMRSFVYRLREYKVIEMKNSYKLKNETNYTRP
jgi:hypothetical protein